MSMAKVSCAILASVVLGGSTLACDEDDHKIILKVIGEDGQAQVIELNGDAVIANDGCCQNKAALPKMKMGKSGGFWTSKGPGGNDFLVLPKDIGCVL